MIPATIRAILPVAAIAVGVLVSGGFPARAFVANDLQCKGCVGKTDLGRKSVTTRHLADGAITARKLAKGAVTASKLATSAHPGAVSHAHV